MWHKIKMKGHGHSDKQETEILSFQNCIHKYELPFVIFREGCPSFALISHLPYFHLHKYSSDIP